MSKTKVTLTKVENMISIQKSEYSGGGVYTGSRITFTVQGVEEQKAFAVAHLDKHPELKQALDVLATKQLPMDVVIQESQVTTAKGQTFTNIDAILPKETPEESPRGPKKAFAGVKGRGSYGESKRATALKVTGTLASALGITSVEGALEVAKQLEDFLSEGEKKATEESNTQQSQTKTATPNF